MKVNHKLKLEVYQNYKIVRRKDKLIIKIYKKNNLNSVASKKGE